MELAVDLVNTLDVHAGIDHLEAPEDIGAFLDEHVVRRLRPEWDFSPHDLDEVRVMRARLREVFTATDPGSMAAQLNEILDDVVASPRVSLHGERPHLHFEPADASPARWLGTVAAMGVAVALIEGGVERFGVCGSSTCDDVFVDTSRNRSRRHCSGTCTTRENVAAHRARQRN